MAYQECEALELVTVIEEPLILRKLLSSMPHGSLINGMRGVRYYGAAKSTLRPKEKCVLFLVTDL